MNETPVGLFNSTRTEERFKGDGRKNFRAGMLQCPHPNPQSIKDEPEEFKSDVQGMSESTDGAPCACPAVVGSRSCARAGVRAEAARGRADAGDETARP